MSHVVQLVIGFSFVAFSFFAQEPAKKVNTRSASATEATDPFDGASVEKMGSQCVTLETELGPIEIAMMPEVAPESVRNFLNLFSPARRPPHPPHTHMCGKWCG